MTRGSKSAASTHAKLAILVEIARHGGQELVTTAKMVAAAGISISYIEVACTWLRRRGLIKSVRAPAGGYRLARPASNIFVTDIIDKLGNGFGKKYLGTDVAAAANITDLWHQSESLLMQVYQHISLADIIRGDLQAHPLLKKLRDSCHQETN